MGWILALCLMLGLGCGKANKVARVEAPRPPAPLDDAKAFLKWSMDGYQSFKTYRATCSLVMSASPPAQDMPLSTRSFVYEVPNRFKILSNTLPLVQAAACDGRKVVESNDTGFGTIEYAAPASITQTYSVEMSQPVFFGSLLYQCFGGSSNLSGLISATRDSIKFNADEIWHGEPAKVVSFYETETYGQTSVLIGTKTGLVYRIRYDSEPLVVLAKNIDLGEIIRWNQKRIESMPPGPSRDEADAVVRKLKDFPKRLAESIPKQHLTTETYGDIQVNGKVSDADFDTTPLKASGDVQKMLEKAADLSKLMEQAKAPASH